MKKLIVGITAPGSVILLEGQLKYFTDLGYETYLLAPEDQKTIEFCQTEGCQLLPVQIKREISLLADLSSLWQIINHLRKIKPNIINVGTPKMGLLGSLASSFLGVRKRIYTCRGFRFETEKGFKRKLLIALEKLISRITHKIICISPSVTELGLKYRIFKKEKITVINKGSSNGVNLGKFSQESVDLDDVNAIVKEFDFSGKFVFGFVGRLVFDKGIRELLIAFSQLCEEHNDLSLLLVGSDRYSSPEECEFIEDYKNNSKIHFTGSTSNVPAYMMAIDTFVLPTYREGFGIVLIEAAAMGLPIIATKSTGACDAVKDNYNGILVLPKSIEKLYKTMKSLYEDKELRKKLGTNGIEWAKNFDSEIIWEGMERLYNE